MARQKDTYNFRILYIQKGPRFLHHTLVLYSSHRRTHKNQVRSESYHSTSDHSRRIPPRAASIRRKIRNRELHFVQNFVYRSESLAALRHGGEPAGPGAEVGAAALAVGGGTDESCQGAFHDLAFDAADPDERVRHRRSARVEAVLRVRHGGG